MEHNLSKSELEELERIASSAIPYSDDDPIWNMYDGKRDNDRVSASFAKRILKEYYAEKKREESAE